MSTLNSFWSQVWPNLAASVIWGTPAGVGFMWHHRRLKRHIAVQHEQTQQMIREVAGG